MCISGFHTRHLKAILWFYCNGFRKNVFMTAMILTTKVVKSKVEWFGKCYCYL
jgi:hypothetical protein